MRELLLLRHGHAELLPGTSDFERPLSPRGRAEALDAAHCIRAAELRCDHLLVSPAVRTRQTAEILIEELGLSAQPQLDPTLYLGDASALLRVIANGDARAETLLVVAHNPGISELAQQFAAARPALELRTSGLCLLRFEADGVQWSRLAEHAPERVRLLR